MVRDPFMYSMTSRCRWRGEIIPRLAWTLEVAWLRRKAKTVKTAALRSNVRNHKLKIVS